MHLRVTRAHVIALTLTLSCVGPAASDAPAAPPAPQTADTKVKPDPVSDAERAVLGQPAPNFRLPDLNGKEHQLSDYRGKTVVLEWYNPDCPFVKQAHEADGALHTMGREAAEKGVVWLAINSGAPGKQGHGLERNRKSVGEYALSYPVLLDETGAVGQTYAAATTPHMYVVNADGILVYQGAIDNAPLGDTGGRTRQNFVARALAELAAGEDVSTPSTKPWGCSVKY